MNLRTLTFTIFLLILAALGTALAVVPPMTSLTLAWEKAPSHGTNISFVFKWGSSTNDYNNSTNVGPRTSFTMDNPTTGFIYCIVVAKTSEGLESEPSNMLALTNYPAKPLQLRMTTNTTSSIRIEGTIDGNNWIHLATVTSKDAPATIQSASKSMMIRTVQLPPLP